MSSLGSCKICLKELTPEVSASGMCLECYKSTGATDGTRPMGDLEQHTRTSLQSNDTATHDASPDFAIRAHPKATARIALLGAAHGLVDIVPMTTPAGMGDLYRAYDPAAARPVVVKFVRWESQTQGNLQRFAAEARALARVQHDNVARLHQFVQADDPYFIMEDVAGGSLNERLVQGPLPVKVAAQIMSAAARGVAAANREGVVHRDLKPGNILLTKAANDAAPKVADFGIAKDLDALETLTSTDAIIGTPGYMSPEQANWRSAECDARSDVWGLSATLYCCVTGQAPFDRRVRPPAVLTESLVPPIRRRKDLPKDLNAVICKGLEKEPADRYADADEFADDLNRYLAGEPVRARPRPLHRRVWRGARQLSKVAVAAVLLAACATAVVGAMILSSEATPEEKIEAKLADLKAGKRTKIIPATGMPVWQRPLLGNYAMRATDTANGACTVEAVQTGVCQLVPHMPIKSYELRFELLDIAAPRIGYKVGLIFGLDHVVQPNGARIDTGLALYFRDYHTGWQQGAPAPEVPVRFDHVCMYDTPNDGVSIQTHNLGYSNFSASRTSAAGIWRPMFVKVSPAGVEAYWGDATNGKLIGGVKYTAAQIDEQIAEDEKLMRKVWMPAAAAPLPRWAPDRPFALLCDRCSMGVRNLELIPAKDP